MFGGISIAALASFAVYGLNWLAFRLGYAQTVPLSPRVMSRNLTSEDFGAGKITRFLPREFGAGTWQNVKAEVGYKLDAFAKEIGNPVKVISAWRSVAQNKKIGGAPGSKHLDGKAVDVTVLGADFFGNLRRYVDAARRVGFKGIGIYEGKKSLHLDVRKTPGSWASVGGRMVALAEGLEKLAPVAAPVGVVLLLVGLWLLAGQSRD